METTKIERLQYTETFEPNIDALCEMAGGLIRDIQANAALERTDKSRWGLAGEPFAADVIGNAVYRGQRSAHDIEELSRLFAALQTYCLGHAHFLMGQASLLPEPYRAMVEERAPL